MMAAAASPQPSLPPSSRCGLHALRRPHLPSLTPEQLHSFGLAVPADGDMDVSSIANPDAIQQLLLTLQAANVACDSQQVAREAASRSHDTVLQAVQQLGALASARSPVLRNSQLYASILQTLLAVAVRHERLDLVLPALDRALIRTVTHFVLLGSDSVSHSEGANAQQADANGGLANVTFTSPVATSAADCVPGANPSATPSSAAPPAASMPRPPFHCDDDSCSSILSFMPARDWFAIIRCSRQLYALRTRAAAWPASPLLPATPIAHAFAYLLHAGDAHVLQATLVCFITLITSASGCAISAAHGREAQQCVASFLRRRDKASLNLAWLLSRASSSDSADGGLLLMPTLRFFGQIAATFATGATDGKETKQLMVRGRHRCTHAS
jgi:hypothetical protein